MMLYVLILEYMNYAGDRVEQYLPVYETLELCKYWGDYFDSTLRTLHGATKVVWSCKAVD